MFYSNSNVQYIQHIKFDKAQGKTQSTREKTLLKEKTLKSIGKTKKNTRFAEDIGRKKPAPITSLLSNFAGRPSHQDILLFRDWGEDCDELLRRFG